MKMHPLSVGFGSLAALLILVVILGPVHGQGRNFKPPTFTTEWRCSKCRGLLGQGELRPQMKKCPHCSVGLASGAAYTSANQPKGQDINNSFSGFRVFPFVLAGMVLVFRFLLSTRSLGKT